MFLLMIAAVSQFFRPPKNHGTKHNLDTFFEETQASEELKLMFRTACFDCHSEVTRYPWYSKITPINYWIDNHIRQGKKELNASKWGNYSMQKKDDKLEELARVVKERHKPLDSYTWMRGKAVLSDEQIARVQAWASRARTKYLFREQPE